MTDEEYTQKVVDILSAARAKMTALHEFELEQIHRIGSINARLIFASAAGKVPAKLAEEVQKALDPSAEPFTPPKSAPVTNTNNGH